MINPQAKNTFAVIVFSLTFFGIALGVRGQEPVTEDPVIQAVAPGYPQLAVAAGAEAKVVVEVKINQQGEVTSVRTIEGFGVFSHATEASARHWLFAPANKNIDERTRRLTFVFQLLPADTLSEKVATLFKTPYYVEIRAVRPRVVNDPTIVKSSEGNFRSRRKSRGPESKSESRH